MATLNSESELFGALSDWIKKDHKDLEIQEPISEPAPSPDLYISNKRTGRGLGIELRVDNRRLPVGIYPSLKAMQEKMKEQNNSFVVLSTGQLSDALWSNVRASDIKVYEISDVAQAIEVIEPLVQKIEENQDPTNGNKTETS